MKASIDELTELFMTTASIRRAPSESSSDIRDGSAPPGDTEAGQPWVMSKRVKTSASKPQLVVTPLVSSNRINALSTPLADEKDCFAEYLCDEPDDWMDRPVVNRVSVQRNSLANAPSSDNSSQPGAAKVAHQPISNSSHHPLPQGWRPSPAAPVLYRPAYVPPNPPKSEESRGGSAAQGHMNSHSNSGSPLLAQKPSAPESLELSSEEPPSLLDLYKHRGIPQMYASETARVTPEASRRHAHNDIIDREKVVALALQDSSNCGEKVVGSSLTLEQKQ
jgi:hypothetical protein